VANIFTKATFIAPNSASILHNLATVSSQRGTSHNLVVRSYCATQ